MQRRTRARRQAGAGGSGHAPPLPSTDGWRPLMSSVGAGSSTHAQIAGSSGAITCHLAWVLQPPGQQQRSGSSAHHAAGDMCLVCIGWQHVVRCTAPDSTRTQHAGGQACLRRTAIVRSLNSGEPASEVSHSRSGVPTSDRATGVGSAGGRGWAAHGSSQTQGPHHLVAVRPAGRQQDASTTCNCLGPAQLTETRPHSRPQQREQPTLLL